MVLTNVHSGHPAPAEAVAARAGVASPRRVVLIGGGPASATVLASLATRLTADPQAVEAPVEITVVDRHGETGGGDPHGARTAPSLLLNDKLDDIDSTGIGFSAWLHTHRARWIGALVDSGDASVLQWLQGNREALARTDFGGLYLSRWVFGEFIREAFGRAQRELSATGARVRVVKGEATAVRPAEGGGWRVAVRGAPAALRADAVLLAVGSMSAEPPYGVADHPGYFSYPQARDVGAMQTRLAAVLAAAPEEHRSAVVLGSSAAASEVLYCLEGAAQLASRLNRIIVVSPSGRLADGLSSGIIRPFQCHHLPVLLASCAPHRGEGNGSSAAKPSSAALVKALESDVALGRELGYTIVDILPALNPLFGAVFGLLGATEKGKFVERDYTVYRELVRHTPPDYAAAAARLADSGRLVRVRGRLTGITPLGSGVLRARTQDHPIDAAAVFDCRGFTGVRDTDNPVVADVVANAVAAPNATGRGLRVSESFEAAPGLFVLGPALAGTSHGGTHIWSLENIPRIHALAEQVAAHLWAELTAPAPLSRRPALGSSGR